MTKILTNYRAAFLRACLTNDRVAFFNQWQGCIFEPKYSCKCANACTQWAPMHVHNDRFFNQGQSGIYITNDRAVFYNQWQSGIFEPMTEQNLAGTSKINENSTEQVCLSWYFLQCANYRHTIFSSEKMWTFQIFHGANV